jgi:hypothetical protein
MKLSAAARRAAALLSLALSLGLWLAPVAGAQPVPPADAAPAGAPEAEPLVPAADLVYRTTATFRLAGLPMNMGARTTTRWRRDGARYEVHLHTDTIDFDQVSSGALGPDGALAPASYTEKRPFHHPDSVAIDWPQNRIRFGDAAPVPAPASGAQDRLSLQFELARLYQRHPDRFAAGSTHDVALIGTHDVDPWRFTVGAEEVIETGRGPVRAVRFSARRPVGAVEETIDIWLGADLRWLPVRIRMVDRNHAVIDSVLQSAQLS